jgi:membrane protein required for colicin V production
MNWLDLILLVAVAVSVVSSFRKGLTREIIGLVAAIAALVLGIWLYAPAGAFLIPYVSSRWVANLAGFAIVFAAVMMLGGVVSFAAGKLLKLTGLSVFDHLLGAAFGVVRGMLLSTALVMAIMAFSPGTEPPRSVVDSRLAPYVVDTARVFASMAPRELKDGFRRTYAQVKEAWAGAMKKGMGSWSNSEKAKPDERKF